MSEHHDHDQHARSDDATFWEGRYQAGRTAWDLGGPAVALEEWLERQPAPTGHAVVLGCGRGYDAVALAEAGFHVTAIDIAPSAVEEARAIAGRAKVTIEVVQADLLALGPEFEDVAEVVFEHTFLCAIPPDRRSDYRQLVTRLLKPGGRLVGIFLTEAEDPDGPPFSISAPELRSLLAPELVEEDLMPLAPERRGGMGSDCLGVFRRVGS